MQAIRADNLRSPLAPPINETLLSEKQYEHCDTHDEDARY